jgi:hypothetical protein
MRPVSASRFIPEIGVEDRPAEPSYPWSNPKPMFNTASASARVQPQRSDDAYERGLAAGKAAALAEIETRLEAQRMYYGQQLELERFTWANREAEKLAEKFTAGLSAIETSIANATARILKPFLAETAHRQAIAELVDALEIMIAKNQGITIEIFGPEDLLQLIREKLSDRNVAAVFSPGSEVDVRVVAGQTILETNLSAWIDRLRRE